MKTRTATRLLLPALLALLLAGGEASAQRRIIGDVTWRGRYTDRDIARQFGRPDAVTRTEGGMQADEDRDGDGTVGVCTTYEWKGLTLSTEDGGYFSSLYMNGKVCPLFPDDIEGGVSVGDDISRVFGMKNARPKKVAPQKYVVWPQFDGTTFTVLVDRNGRIMSMNYCKTP